MSTGLKIQKASLANVPALAPLFDAYRSFYGKPSDLSLAEKFLRERLAANESVIFFCHKPAADAIAGFTQLYPFFSSVSAARILVLNDLYVAPDSRRLGIGRALMQAAHDHARQTGAVRVDLSTAHTNKSAQALYESFGYAHDTDFRTYSLSIA